MDKGRPPPPPTVVLHFNVIHGLSDARVEEPRSNTDRVSLQNGEAG